LDEANKKLYIYGGWGMSSTDNNMYVLDINNWSWTRVAPTGYPADAMPSLTPSTPGNQDTSHSKASTGTIAGAAVGGAIGTLIIIAVIAFFIIKRKRRARSSKETITQDVDENMNDLQKDDNPFYYSGGGYYSTRDDKQHDQLNHSSSSSSNALYRKGFGLNGGSTQTSLAKRSEIGDSDKVVTGVLEALPSEYAGTAAATLGSRSPRESFRNSKVLLSPVECSQGQVPNEITSQKPNEFSIPAARFQNSNNTPIDHHYQQQPDSMEVLTSMTTNASSVMNNIGGKIRSVPVTHSTVDQDDNWPDSTSVTHQNTPIQYILPNSNQIGSTTSTQTWDTKHLVTHHQYPSSTLNMPIAQAVTPPTTKSSTRTTLDARQPNIYNSTSPLDALASLGMSQENLNSSSSTTSAPLSSTHDAAPSSASSSNTSSTTQHQRFKTLAPLIAMLPRRYKVDERQSPIIGPSNSILFATNNQERPVAIKSFGRREAWERECRTLIKLKSPCIVEILEVLTIQHEQNNDQVKYVTVMERLDQNLHYYLKRNSNHGSIARDILKCLEWCHGNGIAFCDLKPSNIMYDTEQCKLIDFEASRTIDEECVGVITPRYCPPEVARATTYGLEGANGVVATASVDLWSLGCVLFVSDALFSVL
jgi:hypothetical protein